MKFELIRNISQRRKKIIVNNGANKLYKNDRIRKQCIYSYLYGPPPHCEKENRLGNGSISSGGNVENEFISSALQ